MSTALDGHVFFCGKTRSGKTVRVIYNLQQVMQRPDANEWSILIVNPKNSKDWNSILKPTNKLPKISEDVFRINWVLKPHEHYLLNYVLQMVYARKKGKILVIMDEGQTVNDAKVPYAAVLWTQGLENKKIIWILAQRPAIVSRFAITQCTYFYIYSIKGEDDIKLLNSFMAINLDKYIKMERVDKSGVVITEKKSIPRYHTLFYDDVNETEELLTPCPDVRKDFKIPPLKPSFNKWFLLVPIVPLLTLLR